MDGVIAIEKFLVKYVGGDVLYKELPLPGERETTVVSYLSNVCQNSNPMKVKRTMSVADFKVMLGVATLRVIQNPDSSKGNFITTESGKVVAAVSKNYDSSVSKEIIEAEDGTFILHNVTRCLEQL